MAHANASRACAAAAKEDLRTLRTLVESGVDINGWDHDCRTPLHIVAADGKLSMVRELVETFGADVNAPDRFEGTPLDAATRLGHQPVVEYLASKGATAGKSASSVKESELLCDAAAKQDLEVIRSMVRKKTDPNGSYRDRRTPLHIAAAQGNLLAVRCLVEQCKADMNPKDRWGATPLDDALRHGGGGGVVYRYLKKKGGTSGRENGGDIDDQASMGDSDGLRGLESRGADINKGDADGRETLCLAASNGLRYLVKASAGDADGLRQLASSGVDLNKGDDDGRTPLHFAASNGLLVVARCLVGELNCDPSVVDRFGNTPLDDAIRSGFSEVAMYLQERGGARGKTATHAEDASAWTEAGCTADMDTLRSLGRRKPDVNIANFDGRTALHVACAEGRLEVARVLVEEMGADVALKDKWGMRPLDDAIRSGSQNLIDFLRSKGASPGVERPVLDGATLLCAAAARNDVLAVRDLLRSNASVNAANRDSRTALHAAASRGHVAMLQLLIQENQASTDVQDRWGNRPLDCAIKADCDAAVHYLESIGAEACPDFQEIQRLSTPRAVPDVAFHEGKDVRSVTDVPAAAAAAAACPTARPQSFQLLRQPLQLPPLPPTSS